MASEEYLRRTAITRLSVTPSQKDRIEETLDEWRQGANIATEIGWRHTETRKRKLQSLAYDSIRENTALGSQHSILACFQAAQALSGTLDQNERMATRSKPTFTAPTIPYDKNSMTVFDDGTVSLSTTDGRIRPELVLPESTDGYQYAYLDNDEWSLTESRLTARDDGYFLHLGFRKRKPKLADQSAECRTVLGVDLGIENLAVTSTATFESGRKLSHERRQFERVRRELQRAGTESAHRTLCERNRREERYTRAYLHQVSNAVVEDAIATSCTHIAFENLTHIRDSMPGGRTFHQWAHRRLVDYVRYKATEHGIDVVFVDPEYTSRKCHECGHTSERNRPERDHFSCEECGTTAHADYNAAKNIGWRHVRHGLQNSGRTGDGQLALKSGTVKPNDGFVPYSAQESEVESTDKPHSSTESVS
ncbi:RNA-guided endonuclease InsQ/TnpB family protein [Halovivax cerinus]|uniref:RNA-guided endonuclease InsQ/TnpB family protein n=1 Tax=Halovivax cerinus TaxID=1487865 RepID=UPI0021146A06|nr:transposase [Halovivax cerinus]